MAAAPTKIVVGHGVGQIPEKSNAIVVGEQDTAIRMTTAIPATVDAYNNNDIKSQAWIIMEQAFVLCPYLTSHEVWQLSLVCHRFRSYQTQLPYLENKWTHGIAKALEEGHLPSLIRITLRQPLEPGGARALANALMAPSSSASSFSPLSSSNGRLQCLDLRFQIIGDEGAIALCSAFTRRHLPTLQTLDLGYNFIGPIGMEALFWYPRLPPRFLGTLHLEGNSINPDGASILASALAANHFPHLHTLNVGENCIRDKGAIALAQALPSLTELQVLDLKSNRIETEGAMALAVMLGEMKVLRTLDLMYNQVGERGMAALVGAVSDNLKENQGGGEGKVCSRTAVVVHWEYNVVGQGAGERMVASSSSSAAASTTGLVI